MAKEKAPLASAAPADDKKRAIDSAMAQIEKSKTLQSQTPER